MSESKVTRLKEAILAKSISVFDCLEHYQMAEIYDGTRREQQIKCPGFHGEDRKKSARVYENGTMYCWACDRAYDVFAFEMQYTGVSFTEAVYSLAQRYGIELDNDEDEETATKTSVAEIKGLFKSLEANKPLKKFDDAFNQISKKLVEKRESFSLDEYQKYWYVIDQLAWRVSLKQIDAQLAIDSLERIYKDAMAKRV